MRWLVFTASIALAMTLLATMFGGLEFVAGLKSPAVYETSVRNASAHSLSNQHALLEPLRHRCEGVGALEVRGKDVFLKHAISDDPEGELIYCFQKDLPSGLQVKRVPKF